MSDPVFVRRVGISRSLVATTTAHAVIIGLGLFTGVLTARVLGPADRGILVGLLAYAGVVGPIAMLALDEGLIFQARGSARAAYKLRDALQRQVVIQSALGAAVLAVAVGWIVLRADATNWLAVPLIAAYLILNNALLLELAPFRAAGYMVLWNVLRVLPQVVYAALLLFTMAIGTTVIGACLSLAAGASIGLVTSHLVAIHVDAFDGYETSVSASEAKRFGRSLVLAMTPAFINLRLDQLLLAAVYSVNELGVYAAAASISSLLAGMGWVVESIVFPRALSGALPGAALRRLGAILATVSVGCALLVAVFAEELISVVYGSEFADASAALGWLAFAGAISVMTSLLSALLKAADCLKEMFKAHVSGTVVTLVLLPPLMEVFGLAGAAMACLASAATTGGLMLYSFRRGTQLVPRI